MALSNWDCLAFNNEGEPCNGEFQHFKNEDIVSIYKNWIYVSSKSMWKKDYSFVEPTIARICSGFIELAGFEIQVISAPQNGIFVYANCSNYEDEKITTFRFAGIGCAGYRDTVVEILKTLGCEIKENESWHSGVSSNSEHYIMCSETEEEIIYWDENKQGSYDYSNNWVGVQQSTVEEFFKWLDSLCEDYDTEFKEWIEKCKKAKALRFNQGDMFFAQNGVSELCATMPGESNEPIINKMIDSIKKD